MRVCPSVRIGYSSLRIPVRLPCGRRKPGHADVAQLVEHHLAKVRVAGSNPVVRSEVPEAVSRADGPLGSSVPARLPGGSACGGMAEWFRQGPAKPCTRVRFPLPPRGRLAQRESASLTRKRSLVQSQYRPPDLPARTPPLAQRCAVSGDYRPTRWLGSWPMRAAHPAVAAASGGTSTPLTGLAVRSAVSASSHSSN